MCPTNQPSSNDWSPLPHQSRSTIRAHPPLTSLNPIPLLPQALCAQLQGAVLLEPPAAMEEGGGEQEGGEDEGAGAGGAGLQEGVGLAEETTLGYQTAFAGERCLRSGSGGVGWPGQSACGEKRP
jgi:hypothetical protein